MKTILDTLKDVNPLNLSGSWKTSLFGTLAAIAYCAGELDLPARGRSE